MRKGVSAAQNIRLLRNCRSCSVAVNWNLLYGFPHDRLAWYEETLKLLPLLRHLHPPTGFDPLTLDRFSPYYNDPDMFEIWDLTPDPAYCEVFPAAADLRRIAFHFTGRYESDSRGESTTMNAIRDEIGAWRLAWQADVSLMLSVTRLDDSTYVLVDTRTPDDARVDFLDKRQARLVLLGSRCPTGGAVRPAAERGWIARVDDEWIGLATADPRLLASFEAEGSFEAGDDRLQ
jgi:hypothetical protein